MAIPWLRFWPWAVAVVGLFSGGLLLGQLQFRHDARHPAETAPLGLRLVRAVGLGGAWYRCTVSSVPSGAWIAVDGKDLAQRTPAKLDLAPGVHTVSLTLTDLGTVSYTVRGQRGDRIVMEVPLWGSLKIEAENPSFPVAVSVDGQRRGFAPITIEKLRPGPHEVLFNAPGTPPWGQTIDVPVDRPAELVAHPFQSPATGLIEVRASIASDRGSESLKGAVVWVDRQRRGSTPLKLELPRGPHSIRVVYREEEAPVQVIDLPGGNQRFADFVFGTGIERPHFTQLSPNGPLMSDKGEVISVRLDEVRESDVSEMWLHVRMPEGIWRRYPMVIMAAPGGVVGTAVFPEVVLGGGDVAPYYTSALTAMGDEFFTELRDARPSRSGGHKRP